MKKKIINILLLFCFIFPCLVACNDNSHIHNYSKTGKDEHYHWHYCPKDNEIEEGSKQVHYDNDNDGRCDECNYKIDNHVHDFSRLDYDSIYHWYGCKDCPTADYDTKEAHYDNDKNGECDICGYSMPLPEEENIYISFWLGDRALFIRGPMPSSATKVKLHYKDIVNDKDYYLDNMAVNSSISYIFHILLKDLSVENSPTYLFEIVVYENNSSTPTRTIELTRKDFFEVDEYYKDGNNIYAIVDEEDEKLALKAEVIIDYTVTSIDLKLEDNTPYLVIKAIGSRILSDVKLGFYKDGDYTYIDNISNKKCEFEFSVDLSKVEFEDTAYLTFYSFLYENNSTSYTLREDVEKGSLIESGTFIEANSVKYSVFENTGILIIKISKVN